ncbi:MAG: ribonuclease R [Lactobacillales bacterium]|jgi:ribonuclease R|nr:ribonuclease R [Lactobacillales bacterium]
MSIKEKIVSYLESMKKKSISMEELAHGLELNKSSDFKLLVQTVAQMERDKQVEFNRKGKIFLPQPNVVLEGIFRANERGFGFVTIDPEEPDVFIPTGATSFAMDGDTVTLDILRPASPFGDKGAEGQVLSVVKRATTQIVGVFSAYTDDEVEETDLYGFVAPKDKKIAQYTAYVEAEGVRPVEGSVVILELTHYPDREFPKSMQGIVTKVVGHVNDPGMDILQIVHAHGISPEFPEQVLKAADKVPDKIRKEDLEGRRDLRDQLIVTIDGADAKDLDDAVTVWKLENGHFHLGVHIADVSYYVTENSVLDLEASDRATSVYLTDRVIPMLPQRLSNGICSLNPKVPRLTMSCEMEIDENGTIVNYDIFQSVIQTTERMTYSDVNLILEEKDEETMERYAELVPMFEQMGELHKILEAMRERRGAISFEDHEAKVVVDENGHPQEILLRMRGLGERLIESFMLAANETVARHFSEAKLPFIYRVHEHPKAEKLERFFDFASVFGIVINGTTEHLEPKELQNVLEQVNGKPEEMVINTMLLRSLQQARYSETNYGHYGLAAEYYTHFTSPIRRYPDLIVHRLIRSYMETKSEKRQEKWALVLPEIADHSSQMERRAVETEREVDAMKKAEYMSDKIGEEFEGIISSVMKFGFFVELPNTIEGLIHINSLKHDYFHYIEKHMALVGERTGTTFKLGQKVVVKVEKADPDTREIDFSFVSAEAVTPLEAPNTRDKKWRNDKERQGKNRKDRRKQGKHKEYTAPYDKKKAKKPKKTGKKPFYKAVAKKGKKKK